jgi:hypothetical protein
MCTENHVVLHVYNITFTSYVARLVPVVGTTMVVP